MRKLPFLAFLLITAQVVVMSCRMAPSQDNGDTVSAKEFYPPDTAALHKAAAKDSTLKPVADSADIFVIGPASTRHEVQLLSFPSRRDSAVYAKSRHIRVRGNADIGHVVRAVFFTTPKGDTLVTRITELKQDGAGAQ